MERVVRSLSAWLRDPKYASLRRDFSLFANWQLRRKVRDPTIPEMADLEEISSMLEDRELEWWEQWKLEGLAEGKREGRLEGRLEGLAEGKRDGRLEGLSEGKRKGILEGEARLLHRLLERRFGRLPLWVEEQLAKATEEDLVRWGERTLDLGVSLQQLFGT
jgi:flagellar biosynthesis/type III secretory pathway protein FliH